MTREIWNKIPIDEILDYEASNLGEIRDANGNVRHQYLSKQGYYQCSLKCKNGKYKNFRTNRLVASAFLGFYPNLVVNHIDHNKTNNRIENLEWCTHKRINARRKKVCKLSKEGDIIAEYPSARQAARENSLFVQNISACCLGITQFCGGYKWRYII